MFNEFIGSDFCSHWEAQRAGGAGGKLHCNSAVFQQFTEMLLRTV